MAAWQVTLCDPIWQVTPRIAVRWGSIISYTGPLTFNHYIIDTDSDIIIIRGSIYDRLKTLKKHRCLFVTALTCPGGEENLHDGYTVVPGGVMHRRVALIVNVIDLRQTAVDVRLHYVQQSVTCRLQTLHKH